MILEAFSKTLQREYDMFGSTEEILYRWLSSVLQGEKGVDEAVRQVLVTEVVLVELNGHSWFEGKTPTGKKLLNSLYNYCKSYDHWQFCRWLHEIKASDFSLPAS